MMMLNKATIHRLRSSVVLAACSAAVLLAAPALSAQSISAPLNVTTLAGVAGQRQATDGSGTAARFYAPAGLVVDAAGNLIVADTCNNIFRQVTPSGTVTTFAGAAINPINNPINIGSADGSGAAASFHIGDYASTGGPWDTPIYTTIGSMTLGVDSAGNVYLADTMNDTIREITPAGVVSTLAGGPRSDGSADGSGANARFLAPGGVAADTAGNVYVADSGNDTIRKVAADTAHTVTTFAGTARAFGSADGTGAAASFNNPSGIAIDTAGNLYVTDTANNTVRKITPSAVVTTFAGKAGLSGTADGTGSQARFNHPTGIAVDASGNVYVADTGNNTIRMITPTGTVTTIAGTPGTVGSTNGVGTAALFNQPYGVTVTANGTVYVADTQNNTVRAAVIASGSGSLQITGIPASQVQVKTGTNVTLKIAATGNPSPTYQWSKNGVAISGATNATLQLNSVAATDAASYSVLVTSGAVTYASAPTQLQVFDPTSSGNYSVSIVMQPASRTIAAGQSTTFSVEASSSGTLTYQWNKNGQVIPGATASTYTIASAQATDAAAYTATVTDGTTTLTTSNATLTVTGTGPAIAPSITTQPLSITVDGNATATFTAGASGSPAPTFQWQKNGVDLSNSATISGATSTTLTITNVSSSDAGNYTLVATNTAGTAVSTAATLTVGTTTQPPPPGGPTAWLTNLSVRTTIAAGQSPLIVGLSVSGGAKDILVRGAGPAIAAYVSPVLPDPQLELAPIGQAAIYSNDDWDSSLSTTFNVVGAFPFTVGSKDAAFVQSLNGSYTVKLQPNGSGVVLVEAYDTHPDVSSPRLINISARNQVGTGANVLIEGFAIGGTGTKRLLIRGVGPKLADYGVGGVLADPVLEVHDSHDAVIASNDNWDSSLTTVFDQVGAFHLQDGSKDAALVVNLAAGASYTVVVKGVGDTTGVALVEVYEVQ